MADNHDDVLSQLQSAGLLVDSIEIGRIVRCSVKDDREKRGWYKLHDLTLQSGRSVIVGSYGEWHGNDSGTRKIELGGAKFDNDQLAALRAAHREDCRIAEGIRRRDQARAASRAESMWQKLSPAGESDYLERKCVQPYGVRFTPNGTAVVPLLDIAGRVHGLQFLRSAAAAKTAKRPTKEFWPAGCGKKGRFHLIGSPQFIVLMAEGYATAASIHSATGLPVAVAFDAGNLLPVAVALRDRYRAARILICADDDCWTEGNPGVSAASAAALAVGGAWCAPKFPDEDERQRAHADRGVKATDYNDLHLASGLHVVRTQIEARITALGWDRQQGSQYASNTTTGDGAGGKLKPIRSLEELRDRFALVYGQSGTVFDRQEHTLLSLGDMRDACVRREIHRAWMEHPDRDIVRVREVGFDPAAEDPEVSCNLWAGWPTSPSKTGSCSKLIELLRYLCSGEKNADELFTWVCRWLAYPIQYPGAKMRSCMVLHGPQGAGKNLVFETVMAIYAQYGRVIGQDAVEDRFNDWASRKLFLIADEVVARSDLYHIKNKLKALITGDWIRINPKNIAAYDERNHVNMVFLSNESIPVVLDEDDRRHCVIWTPDELPISFYSEAIREVKDGGAAALHQFLLDLDLGGFNTGTRPPMTTAKQDLIEMSIDTPLLFFDQLYMGEMGGLQTIPALVKDYYKAYQAYCHDSGQRKRMAPMPKFVNAMVRKRGMQHVRKKYVLGQTTLGPHWMLVPSGQAPPPGSTEALWYGNHIATFRQQMGDLCGTP